jgi:hypothetical protein
MNMARSTQKARVQTVLLNTMLASVMLVGAKPLLAQEATGTANAIVFTRQDAAFLKMIDQIAAPRTKEAATYYSNSYKVKFAQGICQGFKQGLTKAQILPEVYQASQVCPKVSAYEYMSVVTLVGVSNYCPEYSSQLSH